MHIYYAILFHRDTPGIGPWSDLGRLVGLVYLSTWYRLEQSTEHAHSHQFV